jgi:hypothetical protein
MQSLKQFHWYSKWSGSVECGEVALLQEDGKWCIAVAGSHDDFASIKDVTTETTSFFVIGGGIRYKFQPLTLSSG